MKQNTVYRTAPQFARTLYADKSGILRTLAYFDIFHYPLTREEIKRYHDASVDESSIDEWLKILLEQRKIFLVNNFYSLHDNPLLALRREKGNERAQQLLTRAEKAGR